MKNEIEQIQKLLIKLFPLQRSLTGEGLRKSIEIIKNIINELKIIEIKSDEEIFDWKVPKEWELKYAHIKDSNGKILVSTEINKLHLVNYSNAVKVRLKGEELIKKIYYSKEMPNEIPYRTSYYTDDWGFCVNERQYKEIELNKDEIFEIIIDTKHTIGSMTVCEDEIINNIQNKEGILISTYICHPSLANDNLSGVVLTTLLWKWMKEKSLIRNYYLSIAPETIGALAYLKRNFEKNKFSGAIIPTTVGGPGEIGIKKSFLGDSEIDKAALIILSEKIRKYKEYKFSPDGSDERQYSASGFRIPSISITKDKYYEYKQYHTSADNLEFIDAKYIIETLNIYKELILLLDVNNKIKSNINYGELMLSKRNLYPKISGHVNTDNNNKNYEDEKMKAISWILFYRDGDKDLIDIIIESGIDYKIIIDAYQLLKNEKVV